MIFFLSIVLLTRGEDEGITGSKEVDIFLGCGTTLSLEGSIDYCCSRDEGLMYSS